MYKPPYICVTKPKNMTNSNIQLHQQALDTLWRIEENNEQLRKMYAKCVEIEKCPNTSPSFKKMFIEQYHSMIAETRRIKQQNLETYAEIMQRLVQPALEKTLSK